MAYIRIYNSSRKLNMAANCIFREVSQGVFSCVRETCKNKNMTPPNGKPFQALCTGVSDAQRLFNFTKAAIMHLLRAAPTCSDEEITARHSICVTCPLYVKKTERVGYCSHKSCGCTVTDIRGFISKLAWSDQHCPLWKW